MLNRYYFRSYSNSILGTTYFIFLLISLPSQSHFLVCSKVSVSAWDEVQHILFSYVHIIGVWDVYGSFLYLLFCFFVGVYVLYMPVIYVHLPLSWCNSVNTKHPWQLACMRHVTKNNLRQTTVAGDQTVRLTVSVFFDSNYFIFESIYFTIHYINCLHRLFEPGHQRAFFTPFILIVGVDTKRQATNTFSLLYMYISHVAFKF